MEFFFQESVSKKYWLLFVKRSDGHMAWVASRASLSELRALVA